MININLHYFVKEYLSAFYRLILVLTEHSYMAALFKTYAQSNASKDTIYPAIILWNFLLQIQAHIENICRLYPPYHQPFQNFSLKIVNKTHIIVLKNIGFHKTLIYKELLHYCATALYNLLADAFNTPIIRK